MATIDELYAETMPGQFDALNQGADNTVAAATTTDLAATAGEVVTVTGDSVAITGFGTLPAGVTRTITFSGTGNTLVNNLTSLIVVNDSGLVSVAIQAGDTFTLKSLGGGNWRVISGPIPLWISGSAGVSTALIKATNSNTTGASYVISASSTAATGGVYALYAKSVSTTGIAGFFEVTQSGAYAGYFAGAVFIDGRLELDEITEPTTPASGRGAVYFNSTDSFFYCKNDAGKVMGPLVGSWDIILRDEKASTTDGGTFTSGADQVRVLNTELVDVNGDCSLASNQFTLTAGTYEIYASCPAVAVGQHQAWLYNATDGAKVTGCEGTSDYSGTGLGAGSNQTRSIIIGRFTVAASKALEIRHRCGSTQATNGFGIACNFATPAKEIYTVVRLKRVG